MEIAMIALLVLALIAVGVAVTVLIATRMPMDVLVRAQDHGRFAGLGSAEQQGGTGRAARGQAAAIDFLPQPSAA